MTDFEPHFESRIERTLGRIEQKIDGHQTQLSDHEVRIRQNEVDALVAKTIALEADRHAKVIAQKKAALVGVAAGSLPLAFKAAWVWLMHAGHK